MQLFYQSEIQPHHDIVMFSKEESRHMIKVLRKRVGDLLHITNGQGWWFEAEIISAHHKGCEAKILSTQQQPERPYKLHVGIAPTKTNDRFEWFLEKATEFGIDEISPVICDHSERKTIKLERYEKIVQSAMKQSLQCYLPKLNPLQNLSDFIIKQKTKTKLIAHCEALKKTKLKDIIQPKDHVVILIGPEGDFSVEEIQLALQNDFIPVSLGNTRLRTETAAIAACHAFKFINE